MRNTLLCLLALALCGCAGQDTKGQKNPDPLEAYNRKAFAFNDTIDRYVLVPTAKGYRTITPDPVERGVTHFYDNFFEPTTVVNGVLQGKWKQSVVDTGRFLINSTVGLFGLFDVAGAWGLEQHNEDFGQTLGYWGVGPGAYIVVPLLGSYTLRDGFGAIIESQSTSIIGRVDHVPTRNQLWALDVVNTRALLLKADELVTGDRYTFIRDAYLQRREYLVKDGKVNDDFGADTYDDDSFEDW